MSIKTPIVKSVAFLLLAALLYGCSAEQQEPEPRREVKVTVLVGNRDDSSYNEGIVRWVRQAEERYLGATDVDLIMDIAGLVVGSGNEHPEVERVLRGDSELMLIVDQIAIPVLEPAAAYFPDKNFILIDMEATGRNVYSALFKPNEAAFLCGALAAKMSETGVIGIVIGMDVLGLQDFSVGFILGALEADPDCKVIVSVAGSFSDTEKGYSAAADQFERGADVCFGAAGGASIGCIRAASDYGRYAIGVDIDQTEIVAPELRASILTSCMKFFDVLVTDTLDSYLDGTLIFGVSGRFGIKEGAVGIARNEYYMNTVPKDIQDEIDALEEQIRTGAIRVRSAYEMTYAEIDALYKSVRP